MPPRPIPESIRNRKGARTTASVPPEVLKLLHAGRIESISLCEWLVVDQAVLARAVFRELGWSDRLPQVEAALAALTIRTAPKRTEAVGRALSAGFSRKADLDAAYESLLAQVSDIPRMWAAYLVGRSPCLNLREKLARLRKPAADSNMGVREIAWFAVRDEIAENLDTALRLLEPFTRDTNPAIRRFASEATRPRGVWCCHIDALKQEPRRGLPLLEPLRSDGAKYVRDSVGNWLNDASKSQPDWVRETCRRWEQESPTPETTAIVKRALRTLRRG